MDQEQKIEILSHFVEYCKKRLQIQGQPQMRFTSDRDWAVQQRSFGSYNPNTGEITVYVGNRNLADILRTLAHELVHEKQREDEKLEDESGETGSEIENQANALAGVLMRDYGKINDLIYESRVLTLKEVYEIEKEIIKLKK